MKKQVYGECRRLNLALEEDRNYYLDSVGGEENLRGNYPTLYTAYKKGCQRALKRTADSLEEETSRVYLDVFDIQTIDAESGTDDVAEKSFLAATISGSFLDPSNPVADGSPAKRFDVELHGRIYDPNSPRMPYLQIHDYYADVNQIGRQYQSENLYRKEEFWDRMLRLNFTVSLYDTDGVLTLYKYEKEKKFGNPTECPVSNITIEAPVSSHPETNQIRILYGRSAQNLDKPDYIYASNNPDKNNGTIWTIVPIKGSVTLKNVLSEAYYYSFERLTKADEDEDLRRSALMYAGKDWKVFREDMGDSQFYDLLTKNDNFFKVETKGNHVETLHFDLFNPSYDKEDDRHYDWCADFTKAATDNRERICYLSGGFTYDICKKDKSGKIIREGIAYDIILCSIAPEDLPAGRTYYTYKQGSFTIYIPPIHLWWGCHAKDTMILMADGLPRQAQDIRSGDMVRCVDGVLRVENVFTGYEEKLFHIRTDRGAEIKVSAGHPILMADGKGKCANQICEGDSVMLFENEISRVTEVKELEYKDKVYNFVFEGAEKGTYLIAEDFYSGDFYMQNLMETEVPAMTEEREKLIKELQRICENIH